MSGFRLKELVGDRKMVEEMFQLEKESKRKRRANISELLDMVCFDAGGLIEVFDMTEVTNRFRLEEARSRRQRHYQKLLWLI
jgi:hypothetical protein